MFAFDHDLKNTRGLDLTLFPRKPCWTQMCAHTQAFTTLWTQSWEPDSQISNDNRTARPDPVDTRVKTSSSGYHPNTQTQRHLIRSRERETLWAGGTVHKRCRRCSCKRGKWETGIGGGGREGSRRLNRCSCCSASLSGITAVSHAQIHTAWNTHRQMHAHRVCG